MPNQLITERLIAAMERDMTRGEIETPAEAAALHRELLIVAEEEERRRRIGDRIERTSARFLIGREIPSGEEIAAREIEIARQIQNQMERRVHDLLMPPELPW